MKISFIPTLVIAGSLMPFFQLQAVDYYLVNSDGSGKSSFATNTTGTGSGWGLSVGGSVVSYFPTAGNNYIVGNPNSNASGNFDFRTPADANDYTFAGDSLTINNSGGTATTRFLLVGTATRTITVNHLILNGGQVFCAASAAQTLAGNITLNGTTSPAIDRLRPHQWRGNVRCGERIGHPDGLQFLHRRNDRQQRIPDRHRFLWLGKHGGFACR